MEANELRIGNYYWSGYNLKISRLMGFIPEESGYEIEGVPFTGYLIEGCDKLIPWGSLDPIPLTEEWLLNFGFKMKDKDTFHLICDGPFNSGFTFDLPSKSIGLISKASGFQYIDVAIDYVHQLQNLFFALKGKELTLKEN